MGQPLCSVFPQMESQPEAEAVTDGGSNMTDAVLTWCGAEAEERGRGEDMAKLFQVTVKCCDSTG